jgi:hypothetical protein
LQQGDQIWRIFAIWATVYFGQFFDNDVSIPVFCPLSSPKKICQNTDERIRVKQHFGRFFTKKSGHTGLQLQWAK